MLSCDSSLASSARVDARNEASLRLGRQLGMRREAYPRGNEWFKGAWSDEVDLALLDSEWAAQHPAGQRLCSGSPVPETTAR